MEIHTVPLDPDTLGEAPVWDHRLQALYWSDQLGRRVRRFNPASGDYREWTVPKDLGCIALTEDASVLLIALSDGFYRLELETGQCTCFVAVPQPRPGVRLNDGRCDRRGNLVAGTVTTDGGEPAGMLYRVSPAGEIEVVRSGMVILNSICCAPAGDRIYYADSRGGVIYARNLAADGALGPETSFTDTRPHGGVPDGATVDSEGGVWVAQIVLGRILRFLPDGTLERVIDLPVPHISSLAFGGHDLDLLYVTTFRETGMLLRSDHPDAGKLFAISGLGVQGVEEGIFGGTATSPR